MRTAAVMTVALVLGASVASAQGDNVGSVLSGAALGGVGTALLAATGALAPCALTLRPARCTRAVALGAGVVGAVAGAALGGTDGDRLVYRWRSAGVGAAAGAVMGLTLLPVLPEWSVRDALALTALGGSVGAAPAGSAIGFGVGMTTGLVWALASGDGSPFEILGFGLVGLAAGALTEWVVRAASADAGGPFVVFSLRVPLP